MSIASEVLADSPASFYLQGEASGTLADSGSANKPLDSIFGSPTYAQPGPDGLTSSITWPGSAVTEAYAKSSATIGSNVSATGLTLEAWFYLDAMPTADTGLTGLGYGYTTGSDRHAHLFIKANGQIALTWGSSSTAGLTIFSSSSVTTGRWYHAVGTVTPGGVGKVRLDKVDVASGTTPLNIDTSAFMFVHGGAGASTPAGYSYNLTDSSAVKIAYPGFYRTALSDARIDAHYDAAFTGPQVAANHNGSGSLSAAVVKVAAVAASFAGAGVLAATVVPVASVATNFTGSGTLSATAIAADAPPETAANFTGSGALSATVVPAVPVVAAFNGSGNLAATVVPVVSVAANFTGSGTLAAATTYTVNPYTDTGRISGRTRGGYGVATWFPPVVPLPPSDEGARMLVAAAFGPQTMDGTQPVYTISEAHTPRARQQILVDGLDISGFRGIVTPDVTYQTQEPLLHGPGDLTLPQVACTEEFGVDGLWWLREDAVVIVNEVLDDVVVRAGVYKGFINAFDVSGKNVVAELGGEAHGTLEAMNRQIVVVPRVNDIGHQLAVDLDEAGIKHHPPLGRVTGIETLTTGGTGLLEHFQGVLAQGWTRAGRQWTVMPDPATGVYETHRKDDTTIHWTAFIDDARTVLSVRRDTSEEYNRIFGSGVTPRGMRVRNAIIPGIYQGPVPDFPGHMEIGDTGIGVQLLIQKLQAVNYLDLRDTPGGYDDDVAEAVVDLQDDAGFFENGFTGTAVPGEVNLATWRALYDVDITGQSLAWARVLPMAQRSRVKEWRRSGTGGILGPNPGYDETAKKRDRNIEFPAGLTRAQQFEFCKADLQNSNDPNWLGTLTCHTGALLRGLVETGAIITAADVAAATEALPGHNIRVPNFQGGTLFHIAAAQVGDKGIVTFTIDTRFRDAPEVWEIMDRNKQAKADPARRANQRHRSSTMTHDSIGDWFEHGGILGNDVKLNPGWNVFEVTAAMEGTIAQLRLLVQTVTLDGGTLTVEGHEFVCAVFGRDISPARLKQLVPAPLTKAGAKAWESKRDELDQHWILYSAGTRDEPCGYSPGRKRYESTTDEVPNPDYAPDADGNTTGTDDDEFITETTTESFGVVTGKHVDDAGFAYRSESRTKLYVTVYVRENVDDATIPAGRIMWPQLESGV